MKKKIRDLVIMVLYYSGMVWLYQRGMRRRGPLVRVLCFHDVPDRAWFVSVLDTLQRDYQVITPQQFEDKEFDQNKINVLLTFDDGYQSWIDVAAPELEARTMKGIFFINSGLLDAVMSGNEAADQFLQARLLLEQPRQLLHWEGAQQLVDTSHTIGAHTVSHARLATLTTEEIYSEVGEDIRLLEKNLGITIKHFAYPFGTTSDYTSESLTVVADITDNSVQQYSSVSHFVMSGDYKSIIPRTLVLDSQPLVSLRLWLAGGYDLFSRLK